MAQIPSGDFVRQALKKINKYKAEIDELKRKHNQPIAIIGMSCRFPGDPHGTEGFWQTLKDGKEAIREIPRDRWWADAYFHEEEGHPGTYYTKSAGFIDGVDTFDSDLFNISRREAKAMDPQQRLLLELCWEALENAGYAPNALRGSDTAVFVAMGEVDYSKRTTASGDYARINSYSKLGATKSIGVGRISYAFDFTGPCSEIDTSCSSSLLAIHLACQSLRGGESGLAVAGGVNLLLSPEDFIGFCSLSALSRAGHCYAFDERADGYVRGEGAGLLLLKRLDRALADDDNILAIIEGSAANHDGFSNGLTAPNGGAQTEVIRKALDAASLRPEQVQYVEAHGTGTRLGDPIEVHALHRAYGTDKRTNPLLIGSVKTNIGHLESAAGVSSIIKVVLALGNRVIPPTINHERKNSHVSWGDVNVKVVDELTAWSAGDELRRAGVSGFGMSGTNVHIILREAEKSISPRLRGHQEDSPGILTISARTPEALHRSIERYSDYLRAATARFEDIARASQACRNHFVYRQAVIAGSNEAAEIYLIRMLKRDRNGDYGLNKQGKITFLFTGTIASLHSLDFSIYEKLPPFKRAMGECDNAFADYLGKPLTHFLSDGHRLAELPLSTLQSVLFAIQYSLFRAYSELGVTPSQCIGHSFGEYAACCAAGALTLSDAAALVFTRARLIESSKPGKMVSVPLSRTELRDYLHPWPQLCVAAVNGEAQTVVSGPQDSVEELCRTLSERGIAIKTVDGRYGFHSGLMESAAQEFKKVCDKVEHLEPLIPVISTVTSERLTREAFEGGSYWSRQMLSPVEFHAALTQAFMDSDVFVELGAAPILTAIGMSGEGATKYEWLCNFRRNRGSFLSFLETLGKLYERWADIKWVALSDVKVRKDLFLPVYPFQKTVQWIDAMTPSASSHGPGGCFEIVQQEPGNYLVRVGEAGTEYVNDHVVFDSIVFPAAGFVEILAEYAASFQGGTASIKNIRLENFAWLPGPTTFCIKDKGGSIRISSGYEPEDGKVLVKADLSERTELSTLPVIDKDCVEEVESGETIYSDLEESGLHLGSRFRTVVAYKNENGACFAKVLNSTAGGGFVHPTGLDGCFQTLLTVIDRKLTSDEICIPVAIECVEVLKPAGPEISAVSVLNERDEESGYYVLDVDVLDEQSEAIMLLRGVKFLRVSKRQLEASKIRGAYVTAWEELDGVRESASADRYFVILSDGSDWSSSVLEVLFNTEVPIVVINTSDEEPSEEVIRALSTHPDVALIALYGPQRAGESSRAGFDDSSPLFRIHRHLSKILEITESARVLLVYPSGGDSPSFDDLAVRSISGYLTAVSQELYNVTGSTLDAGDACPSEVANAIVTQAVHAGGSPVLRLSGGSIQRNVMKRWNAGGKAEISGVYLVTGATGAIGSSFVSWLSRNGASDIIVVGRRESSDLAELGGGSNLHYLQGDVASDKFYERLAGLLNERGLQLNGIIHAAGINCDGSVLSLGGEEFSTAFAAKAVGAWKLHRFTLSSGLCNELRHFALMSSMTVFLGSQGQANYVAANQFLHELARARNEQGLPCTAIAWGPWKGAGMADSEAAKAVAAKRGITYLEPNEYLNGFDMFIASDHFEFMMARVDWSKFAASLRSSAVPEMLHDLLDGVVTSQSVSAESIPPGRKGIEAFITIISEVVESEAGVDPACALAEIGVDSLMAVEIRSRAKRIVGVDIPVTELLSDKPIADIFYACGGIEQREERESVDIEVVI